ncbi:CAP domain-containing protein [uncultured Sulfitobacter sp.]|uniref:CAP domain-containing protein n=1 Tax=uncultured Sulfitobacter sp. TaxID=191468 RepID=UPI00262F63FC|nr:CAP domain-containing protein [uncultured Sulfitobacter sp.]
MRRIFVSIALCLAVAACSGGNSTSLSTSQADTPAVLGSSGGGKLNAIRAAAGQAAVRRNAVLDAAALGHAQDMARNGFFDHKGSNGSTVGKRVKRAGYRWCTVAENISKGYSSRDAAFESWRKSAPHYRNMTKRKVTDFGLAKAGDYWVLVLAAKRC